MQDYYGVKLAYCEGRDPSVILGQPTVFPKYAAYRGFFCVW